ncbi:MAG: glycosyltransferase family 4 protein, partial [Clostridia bacterium]
MKIWFVSHYAMPPKYEMREKTQKFAHFFKNIGHEVLLVTASTIHGTDINLISDNRAFIEEDYDGLKYLHIRCSNYAGNGLSRIVNMLEFGWRLKRNIGKFDIPNVIVADVNCINYRAIADICKKYNIRFIIDIRDLWPLSIVEYLNISEKNPIIKYLYHREKSMFIRADEIIFSIEGGWDYIVDKGWTKYIDKEKVHHINNGVDLAQFNIKKETYRMESLGSLCDESSFNVVYTGSIRRANGLLLLLDAAKIIREIQPNIQFLLFGDGDDKPELEKYCREYKLNNVHFLGRIDKNFIPFVLSMADCNVL